MDNLIKGLAAAVLFVVLLVVFSNLCSCQRDTSSYGGSMGGSDIGRSSAGDRDRFRQFGDACQQEADARTKIHGRQFDPMFSGSQQSGAHCHVDGGFSETGAIRGPGGFND